MSHLLGATLRIPGDAWQPTQENSSTAVVLHFSRPTRGYPEGRIRILCDDETNTWWDVSKLQPDWIVQLTDPSFTPSAVLTPRGGGRRSAVTTPGTTSRTRSRRRSSRAADGYDSSGVEAFSDGEGLLTGGALANQLSPTGPTLPTLNITTPEPVELGALGDAAPESPSTSTQQRGRPRKLLRFAPGTISPGAHAAFTTTACGSLSGELPAPISTAAPCTQFSSPLTSPRSGNGSMEPLYNAGYSSAPRRLSLELRIRNTLLVFFVALPALYFHRQLHYGCSEDQYMRPQATVWSGDLTALTTKDFWCAFGYQEPLLAVNLVFLLNVSVLFWFISLLQGSSWLIDPFWTIIPVLIGQFYQHHPLAATQPLRSRLSIGLLWVWSVRLTHSYFRREEWQVGAREDWRYALMAKRMGRVWWAIASFFAVGVTQQLMLVGITLPLLAIHTSTAPWDPLVDTAIFLSAATGIMIALLADNQLRDFMVENKKRAQEGRSRLQLLDTGLWRYSRHPNFFGEQLWWWSLGMWSVVCGQPWMLVGTVFNTLCFVPITQMTEQRMLESPERADLYRQYQRTTSVWVPWFKRTRAS